MSTEFSRLILGVWRIGEWGLSPAEVAGLVEGCLDLGIDTFDLADIYHDYRCEAMFDGTLEQAQRLRFRPQAWSPLGGGRLGREPEDSALGRRLARLGQELEATPEQLAIAWLLRHPAHIHPVLGSGKLARIRQLFEAQDLALDRQAWFELLEAATGNEVP